MKARADDLSAFVRSYRRRWNVGVDEQQFDGFRSRALGTVSSVLGSYLVSLPDLSNQFLRIIGQPPNFDDFSFIDDVNDTPVWKALQDNEGVPSFVFCLESLFHLPFEMNTLERLVAGLKEDIQASGMPIVLARSNAHYLFYRKGARLLDERVVNTDLEWLSDYPKALTALENALVQSSDSAKQREMLDSLRVSLEDFLRQVLGNRKSLENNKDSLLKWMDEHDTNTETRQMMRQLFQFYCDYQNNHVKHGDGWKPAEVDFILYLTATFIHLLAELDS